MHRMLTSLTGERAQTRVLSPLVWKLEQLLLGDQKPTPAVLSPPPPQDGCPSFQGTPWVPGPRRAAPESLWLPLLTHPNLSSFASPPVTLLDVSTTTKGTLHLPETTRSWEEPTLTPLAPCRALGILWGLYLFFCECPIQRVICHS